MFPIDDFLGACINIVKRDRCDVLLWHYTDMASFVKIAEEGSVVLTSYSFMNDPQEGRTAPRLMSDVWKSADLSNQKLCPPQLLPALDTLLTVASDYRERADPETFVFCFTTLRDSLSQWSRYAADGAGVALGFSVDPATIAPFPGPTPTTGGPFLYEVLYDWESLERHPPETVAGTGALRDQLARTLSESVAQARDLADLQIALYTVADHLKPIIKHAAYHEEREWRLAARTSLNAPSTYEVRTGRFGLTPCMRLSLSPGLRLREVMLGPKVPRPNEWSLEWLGVKHNLEARITRSSLAYR